MLHQSTYPINHALEFLSAHGYYHRVEPDPVRALLFEEEPLPQRSLSPIFSVLEALDTCPLFRNLLDMFPPHIHYAIKASLLAPDPYQKLRLQVLEDLIWKENDMSTILEKAGPVSLPFLLQHESVFGVLEGMLVDPIKYRRELAFFFTQLSMHQLPRRLQKMAITSKALSLKVLPAYSDWYLCSEAEGRLSQSMYDQAVLLINNAILLKFKGKLGGLALQTTLLADGTQLLEGCWYAPIDYREEIRDAFDRGESRLWIEEGEWTLIRALNEQEDNTLLQRAKAYASVLPEQLPQEIANTTRKIYRCNKHERF